MPSANIN